MSLRLCSLPLLGMFVGTVLGSEKFEGDDDGMLESVYPLTKSNFHAFINSSESTLVDFYSPWCIHCMQLEPEYDKAADALRGAGAKTLLAKVDAVAEPELAEEYQVKSYPTLKYFAPGGGSASPVEYDGALKAASITGWVRKRENPTVLELPSESEVHAFFERSSNEGAFSIVAHLKKTSPRAKAYFKAAEALTNYRGDNLRFAVVWLAKSADAKKDAAIVMLRPRMKDPDPKKVYFSGKWTEADMKRWVKQSTYASLGREFSLEKYSSEAVAALGFQGSVVGLTPAAGGLLQQAAGEESQWRFTMARPADLEKSELDTLGVLGTSSSAAISVLHGGKRYVLKESTDEQTLKKLLGDILAKKAKPTYKSQADFEPPSQEVQEDVKVLTGNSFEKHALNPKKDVFVAFYAPWCGHCKKLMPVWTALATKVEKNFAAKGVTIAKMDITENECEETVPGYPFLVLYPAVKKEMKFKRRMVYHGVRELEPLFDFVVDSAVNLEQEL